MHPHLGMPLSLLGLGLALAIFAIANAQPSVRRRIQSYSSSLSSVDDSSQSVIASSDNSGSYTISSSGLGVNLISVNDKERFEVRLPHPNSTFETKIINDDKEMLINVVTPNDSTKRWVSIKITSGSSTVHKYRVSRPNGQKILIQN